LSWLGAADAECAPRNPAIPAAVPAANKLRRDDLDD
jgi:hypothetical protein